MAKGADVVPARRRPGAARDQGRPRPPRPLPHPPDRDVALARLEAARKHLYPLLQQLREDAEWKRWANISVQEELCAAGRGAPRRGGPRRRRPRALRELDARWKQAKEAPKDKAEALWTRFKAARDQVKTSTDAFFAKQAEELAENLKKKEALCERAEALAESTDWLKTAEELREAAGRVEGDGPGPPRGVAAGVGALPPAVRPLLHALAGAPQPAQPRVGGEPREEGGPLREGRGPPGLDRLGGGLGRAEAAPVRVADDRRREEEPLGGGLAALPRRLRPLLRPLQEPRRARAAGGAGGAGGDLRRARGAAAGGGRGGRAARRPRRRACRRRRPPGGRRAASPTTRWPRSTSASPACATGSSRPSPGVRGHRPRPRGEPPQGREARGAGRGPARGARPRRRRGPAADRGGAGRAPARRARQQHDRRPGGGRGEVALGVGRGGGGAGRLEAPRPAAGRSGTRPRGALRAGLPALLRAAAEAERAGRRARRGPGAPPRAGRGPRARFDRGRSPDERSAPCPRRGRPPTSSSCSCSPRGAGTPRRPGPAAQVLATFRNARVLAALPAPRRRGRRALAAHHPRARADARRPRGPRARARRARRRRSCATSAGTSSRCSSRGTCGGSTTPPARCRRAAPSTSSSPR